MQKKILLPVVAVAFVGLLVLTMQNCSPTGSPSISMPETGDGKGNSPNGTVDIASIVTNAVASQNVAEGSSVSFTVKFTSKPTADVTVNAMSENLEALSISPLTLTFTTANWDTPQTVTVTGVEDDNHANDVVRVVLAATDVPSFVATVTTIDNDTQNIVSDVSTVNLSEGSTGTIQVALSNKPASNVTVDVASLHTTVATVSASTLTFTPKNWDDVQTITITSPQDDDVAAESSDIELTSTGLTKVSVAVSTTDDDTLSLDITTGGPMFVTEGSSSQINVRLSNEPAADVIVGIGSHNGELDANPSVLTFTSANWDDYQPVSISARSDGDANDDSDTIRVESAETGFLDFPVSIDDDDN